MEAFGSKFRQYATGYVNFVYFCILMEPSFRTYVSLKPLSWLYSGITGFRNKLYDCGWKKTVRFDIPVISVGNITVGGTGKTPHTEYLVSLIKERAHTAVLSRGYGRSTSGYLLAGSTSSDSRLIGDEPFQIYSRFPDICVAVCEDRVKGVRRLLEETDTEAVILDDAFQHRSISPSLNILLTDWNRLLLKDCVMPAGHLRESAHGRRRADIIIVTKCPDTLSAADMESLSSRLAARPEQKVFFSCFTYGFPYRLTDGSPMESDDAPVLALTGIAQPQPLVRKLESDGRRVKLLAYPDHHSYSKRDLKAIETELDRLGPDAKVVTTQKDAARLQSTELPEQLASRIYVLPVSVQFLKDGPAFDSLVTDHLESFKK